MNFAGRPPPPKKCRLCKRKYHCEDMVDLSKQVKEQKFQICKECLRQLDYMLSRVKSGLE